jgi:alanine racemase
MQNTATARIDLTALRHNLTVVRALCPDSHIVAMVKADAYGHGLLNACGALESADAFAVARLQEALYLRKEGVRHRILLLATLLDECDMVICSEQRIDVTAHDEATVALIVQQAQRGPLRVWLELDSGMHRTGLNPEAFILADRVLSNCAGVIELIHMTHLSNADDPASEATQKQLSCFSRAHAESSNVKVSLANSAALITRPETRGDWVRPGVMLYGVNPIGTMCPLKLTPAMSLSARVIAIREIERGEQVGYNGRWVSAHPSTIATVGIGYGDGYPRQAPNGTPVLVNGNLASLVGQVCMDSLMIDVTNCGRVNPGDEVCLWGTEVPVELIARQAQTIAYQLLTSLHQRVNREYRGEAITENEE